MQEQGENTPPAHHWDRPGVNPPFTVVNVMFICGIISPTIVQGDSQDNSDSISLYSPFVHILVT